MGLVTVTAKDLLVGAVEASKRRSSVQFPKEAVRIVDLTQEHTFFSALFSRGEAQMKLYLTLVMMTRKPPHTLFKIRPDHYFAEMLGFEELDRENPRPGPGTRRVTRAMAQLTTAGWVTRVRERGRGSTITVSHMPLPEKQGPWVTLPIELWSRGWINVMSARALFVYTCLRLVLAGKPDDQAAHLTTQDRKNMRLTDDTWQRGIHDLERLGNVRTEITRVVTDRWSSDLSLRKVCYLNNTYLLETDSPASPPTESPSKEVPPQAQGAVGAI